RGHAAVWVSHLSIIIPFLMGVALSLWLYPSIGSGGRFSAFALFMGAAMAITAFPVLARILTDRGLYKTQLGTVTLTVAAVDDITAWSILAVIIPVARATSMTSALWSVGLAVAFALATIYFVRPLVLRISNYYEQRDRLPNWFLAALFVCILLWALVTDKLGIHVIFGAFLLGAIMPHDAKFVRLLTEKLEDFAVVFLLPFFFTFSGIRTNIFTIGTSGTLWLMTLAILAVAIVGKWGGSKLAARFAGLGWREAGGVGVLVNCRGLTELIILNIGMQLGVLPQSAFAMMVIMAVVTTLMTEPALALYYPRHLQRKMIKEAEEGGAGAAEEVAEEEEEAAAAEGAEERPERRRVLVAVGKPDSAEELTQMATLLATDGGARDAEVTLLRVVDVSGTEVSHASSVQDSMLEEAADRLRPLVESLEEAGLDADPLAVAAGDVGETIARIANEREVDLVLLGYHVALFGERLLGGTVGEVLREVQADVAVLVDPHGPRQLRFGEDTRILVPFGGGFHEEAGLDIARRLAASSGSELALLGPASNEDELTAQASETSEGSGADTTPLAVEGDLTDELVERADDFDLLVLGVSDDWGRGGNLESVREEVMEHSGTPYLIVRRHGDASSGLVRWWRNLKQAWHRSDESRSDEKGDVEGQQEVEEAEKQTRERL
ncbi:MAG: cation:proton antiporter, partial [Nitriliruptorales bacterium]